MGNSRISFQQSSGTTVTQQDDYYPFGMEISRSVSSPKNEYLYNKKELQEELGQYDYGARFYDPVIGRWTSPDVLSELHTNFTPYNYVLDNPINFMDRFGLDTIRMNNNTPTPIHKGDVVEIAPGQYVTSNTNEATVTAPRNNSSSNNSDSENDNRNVIRWGNNANRRVVTPFKMRIINHIMNSSNNHNITITSTQRTPADQARVMLHNIRIHGVAYSFRLYGRYGDMVTHVAEEGIANGESDEEIMDDMTNEIINLGPTNVSRHTADPNRLNVIDVAPGSLRNQGAFIRAARGNGAHVIPNPPDPAVHVEITQPR